LGMVSFDSAEQRDEKPLPLLNMVTDRPYRRNFMGSPGRSRPVHPAFPQRTGARRWSWHKSRNRPVAGWDWGKVVSLGRNTCGRAASQQTAATTQLFRINERLAACESARRCAGRTQSAISSSTQGEPTSSSPTSPFSAARSQTPVTDDSKSTYRTARRGRRGRAAVRTPRTYW